MSLRERKRKRETNDLLDLLKFHQTILFQWNLLGGNPLNPPKELCWREEHGCSWEPGQLGELFGQRSELIRESPLQRGALSTSIGQTSDIGRVQRVILWRFMADHKPGVCFLLCLLLVCLPSMSFSMSHRMFLWMSLSLSSPCISNEDSSHNVFSYPTAFGDRVQADTKGHIKKVHCVCRILLLNNLDDWPLITGHLKFHVKHAPWQTFGQKDKFLCVPNVYT